MKIVGAEFGFADGQRANVSRLYGDYVLLVLQLALDQQKLFVDHRVLELLINSGRNDGVGDAGFIFKAEKDESLGGARALAGDHTSGVHHDRDRAVARGGKDIFINILTTTGLVQRYVTDWAGPEALVREVAIRLGVPCYAGDTLTFSGQVGRRAAPTRSW